MKIGNLEVYGVIYKIENLINGKIYIGQTADKRGFDGRYKPRGEGIERVYKYHKQFQNLKHRYNRHLLESIEKYGFGSFKVYKVFDITFSKEELDIKEIMYIRLFDSYKNGYNQSLGGESGSKGSKWTEKQKEVKRKQTIGKNNPFYGKTHSLETRMKISNSSKNMIHTKESKDKLSKTMRYKHKYDKDFIKKMKKVYISNSTRMKNSYYFNYKKIIYNKIEFTGLEECANYLNVRKQTLRSWLIGKNPTPHTYYSKGLYYKGEIDKIRPNLNTIYCEGIYFDNAREVADYYGLSNTTIKDWLNGRVEMDKEFYDKDLKYVYRENQRVRRVDKIKYGNKVLCENKLFDSIRLCADYYNVKKTTMRAWLNGQNAIPKEWIHRGLKYA